MSGATQTNAEYRSKIHAEIRRTLELFTPAVSKTVVRTVADAVLAVEAPIPATGEAEWEYAAERLDAYGVVAERRDEMPDNAETLGDWRSVRRRSAGDWVVTP